jgi:hypothetical protein
MRATRSLTITSLLAAVGAGFAVSAMIGAPIAAAQPGTIDCQAGQVVIDGQCNVPDNNANNVPAPPPPGGTGGPGTGSGVQSGGYGR